MLSLTSDLFKSSGNYNHERGMEVINCFHLFV